MTQPPSTPDNDTVEALQESDRERTYAARAATWNAWGEVDPYVIAPMINPAFMGGDEWPDLRQAHLAARRPDAVLLASDGLADPSPSDRARRANGWEVEFYAIATEPSLVNYTTITDLLPTWLYTLVGRMSAIEAGGRHIVPALAEFATLSVEFDGSGMAPAHLEKFWTERDSIGALINLVDPEVIPPVIEGPRSPIHLVNVKLLTRAETDFIVTGANETDISARGELVERLTRQGDVLVSSLDRESVV